MLLLILIYECSDIFVLVNKTAMEVFCSVLSSFISDSSKSRDREKESCLSQINKMKRKVSLRTNTQPQNRSINLSTTTTTQTEEADHHTHQSLDFHRSERTNVIIKLITCPSVIAVRYKTRRKLTWPTAHMMKTHTYTRSKVNLLPADCNKYYIRNYRLS